MSEQYNPQGSYDIFDWQGRQMGEAVKGTVYDGAPNFRHDGGPSSADRCFVRRRRANL